jgi:hypothetical protein
MAAMRSIAFSVENTQEQANFSLLLYLPIVADPAFWGQGFVTSAGEQYSLDMWTRNSTMQDAESYSGAPDRGRSVESRPAGERRAKTVATASLWKGLRF